MPRSPRPDRLSRDELALLNQRARREWRESDWLARHSPAVSAALQDAGDDTITVDLGAGAGESEQEPGAVVVGRRWDVDRHELRKRTGEARMPDIEWDLVDGLPFEDQTVDALLLPRRVMRTLDRTALAALPAEAARVLVVGGTLRFPGNEAALVDRLRSALEAAGFTRKDWRTYELSTQTRPMEDVVPHFHEEVAMGQHVTPAPRQPTLR